MPPNNLILGTGKSSSFYPAPPLFSPLPYPFDSQNFFKVVTTSELAAIATGDKFSSRTPRIVPHWISSDLGDVGIME